MREAALLASLTIRGSVFGVDISVPLLEVHDDAAGPTAASGPALEDQSKKAAPAPTAEVLELQRRLAASGDHNVVAQMLSNPAQLDPLDVRSIARWLKAKGRDLDIAEEQIHLHAHWRQVFMPAGHIPEDQVVNELASGKVYLQGNDVHGRTVFVVLAKQQEKGRAEETKRFICYTLDNAIVAADPACNELRQFLCLFDLSGLRMKNLDVGALQAVFEVLQQHYPERLGELWFLNAPFIFWGLWRVVSPFIQPATKDKIKFLSGRDREQMLQQHIPQDVLPQAYGGEAEMIPIETAVHARLVREGLEQAKSAPANAAADGASDSEGRLARAGRTVQRWGSATADFARRHNPVNAVAHSKTLNRVKGWRPFNRDSAVLYVDEATSTKGDGDGDSALSQMEGGVGHLVMYLMPQVFIVAIFRKAQQALWWAWSHAQRMKCLQQTEHAPLEGHEVSTTHTESCDAPSSPDSIQGPWVQSGNHSPAETSDCLQTPSPLRRSLHAHRLSLSARQYTSAVASRLRLSVEGFDYLQDASPQSSPCSFSISNADLQDDMADEPYTPALNQREVRRLRRLWKHHMQLTQQSSI